MVPTLIIIHLIRNNWIRKRLIHSKVAIVNIHIISCHAVSLYFNHNSKIIKYVWKTFTNSVQFMICLAIQNKKVKIKEQQESTNKFELVFVTSTLSSMSTLVSSLPPPSLAPSPTSSTSTAPAPSTILPLLPWRHFGTRGIHLRGPASSVWNSPHQDLWMRAEKHGTAGQNIDILIGPTLLLSKYRMSQINYSDTQAKYLYIL